MWHDFYLNEEKLIVPANTSIGKLNALERCVAEVTTITENTTSVSLQFDDIVDKGKLSNVQRPILIQLLQQNYDVFGEKIKEMGRSDLVQHYTDVGNTRIRNYIDQSH